MSTMKKQYLLFLLFGFLSNAQIVNIPDANFKEALLNYQPVIDTNSNGEIEVSEALSVTSLNLSINYLSNLIGIESFTNLNDLSINGGLSFTSLDLSSLINLQSLNLIYGNELTTLNLNNLPNLQTVNCHDCDLLNQLNMGGTTNLTSLICRNSDIISLDMSQHTNLQTLNCPNSSELSSINLSGNNNLTYLDCSNCNLTTLDLSSCTNLNYLNCSANQIATLDLTQNQNLIELNCSRNQISILDISDLTELTYLNCYQNLLSSLDVNPLINLTYLDCHWNYLSSLNVSNLVNLVHLGCSNNQLTSLDVTSLVNLSHLDCELNELSSLNVSPLTNLTHLSCHENQLTNLDLSGLSNLTVLHFGNDALNTVDISMLNSLTQLGFWGGIQQSLNFNNLSNLTYFYLKTNSTSFDLSNLPESFFNNPLISSMLQIQECPNLNYLNFKTGYSISSGILIQDCLNLNFICCNDTDVAYFSSFGNQNTQANSYCSFVPGGIYNTISGTATLDINNNGCDTDDYQPNDLKININDGITSGATFSNNGDYAFYTQTGSFTLTPQFENPYFTVSPTTATLNFADLDGSTQTQNFCITPNGVHNDVDVVLLPSTPARPGFDATYQIVYKNKGNQALSGTVNFSFDDAILDFVTATPVVDTQTVNVLSWNYSNLLPFESRTIHFTLNVNAPTETPAVNINDVLSLAVMIEPIINDETPSDNVFDLEQIVVGSYDPNDKTCLEGNFITPEQVGDYLHYLIRFQNSGTAPAENVVVKDLIDTTKFDLASFQLTATSHPQVTRITGNKVEFIFEGIQLPAEQDNEPASHGSIAFKIRTKNNLVLGNTVSNTADIYFDYNFPIITNTATTTVVALGIDEFENASVVMTPNPVTDTLIISADDTITSIQMYDIQGRLITTQLNNSTTFNLDMSQQNLGIYFVKVITENGVKVEKIVKE